ncbi:MAG TPA: branched-chain amino acid ABC transporter permease [Beijerinckiaceae bacterium]|jgi:branched-chain amino acid transport system permease protein|nr:branched-chain amino acid ABC transporter permease [Beijerinckiaceae bacterium]
MSAFDSPQNRAASGTGYFASLSRWNVFEILFWLALAGLYFWPHADLVLMSQIFIWGLFAMSLDVLLGYRGIPSLGHAAFFGIGAYVAGYCGKFGWTEPISALVLAMLVAAGVGWLTGKLVQRVAGVALLMVTLGLNLILYDLVHRSTEITGGDDGLQGIVIDPVLGLFRFDIFGRTAFCYALIVTFVLFVATRAIIKSPFGLALTGARENSRRMIMLGAPVEGDVSRAFALAAALAGAAGALLTQTTQFVAPSSLSFQRSADVLVILIIGGAGRLYGGFIGALIFLFLRDWLAAISPVYWYFWIGLLLVVVVSFFRKGILPTIEDVYTRWRGRRGSSP